MTLGAVAIVMIGAAAFRHPIAAGNGAEASVSPDPTTTATKAAPSVSDAAGAPAPGSSPEEAPAQMCSNGAHACAADALIEWMDGDGHVLNYVCPNPERQTVLKVGLVRGPKLDVARLHMFVRESQRWAATVLREKKPSSSSDLYVLRGERQFAAEDEDVMLSLRTSKGGASYIVQAVESAHPENTTFILQGSCTRAADKTGVFAISP